MAKMPNRNEEKSANSINGVNYEKKMLM